MKYFLCLHIELRGWTVHPTSRSLKVSLCRWIFTCLMLWQRQLLLLIFTWVLLKEVGSCQRSESHTGNSYGYVTHWRPKTRKNTKRVSPVEFGFYSILNVFVLGTRIITLGERMRKNCKHNPRMLPITGFLPSSDWRVTDAHTTALG